MNNALFQSEKALPICISLFDYMDDVIFFVKNKAGEFVNVNTGFINTFGFTDKEEVIGKTDYDLFKPSLADMYHHSDELLIQGKLEIYHKEEVIQQKEILCNYITTKFPVKTDNDEVAAVIGITRNILNCRESTIYSPLIKKALDYIDNHYNEEIRITDLSSLSNMSDSTFLRAFKRDFGLTPKRYIITRRLKMVAKMIEESNKPFCEISVNCGFSDQSHMSREFKKVTGITPSLFQERVRLKNKIECNI